ncbi:MAG: hypothetical protein K2N31_08500 [Treponemataceae bacterium]|nr:hypothetical protein [Treponemataceae bacterium]
MKKIIQIFIIVATFVSCASTKNAPNETSVEKKQTSKNTSEKCILPSDIFDRLQRPLGHKVSTQLQPVSRKNWEYHMAGIGWWDIYLLSGKKLGNGIYEKSVETTADNEIIELHGIKSPSDNTVNMVEILFVAQDKNSVENIRNEFQQEATKFFGKQGKQSVGSTEWESGWFSYASYSIQQHESGKWIYLVSAFDASNSLY